MNFASNLRKKTSLSEKSQPFTTAFDQNIKVEKSPYVNNIVTRGTFQTAGKGYVQLQSKIGGTNLISVDSQTGNISIAGNVDAPVILNIGTVIDVAFVGSTTLSGSMAVNVILTGTLAGATYNNTTLGTPAITGGTATNLNLGTMLLTTNSGSTALGASGNLAIQMFSGSAILAARIGATTYKFTSDGTLS